MARMLQALKNLEARSPAKPAPKPKAPPTPPVANLEPAVAVVDRPVEPPKAPPVAPAAHPIAESIDALAGHLASLEISIQDPPGRFELGPVAATPFSPPSPRIADSDAAKPPVTVAAPPRTMCEIERLVRRTLGDAARAKPLAALAARLRQDMQQTAAKTLAFVGVGSSATHDALLYAATLLAEQSSGSVLLVDGDVGRRALSEALEFGRDRGLAELLQTELGAREVCQPTAVEKLM